MIPISQSRVGADGNCWAACIASILEVQLADIPDFSGDGLEWLEQVALFLEPLGLFYVQVAPDDPILQVMFSVGDVYSTIEGKSPRGGQHAIVGRSGVPVHDPHPLDGTGRGLVSVDCFGLLCSRFANSSPAVPVPVTPLS